MDILKITFNATPIFNFAVQLIFADADGSNSEEIIFVWKDIRANVNEVTRDSNLVQQALNLEYAISIDYPTKLIAIADGNSVSIYFKNGKFLTSYDCSFFNTQTIIDFDQLTGNLNVMSVNSPYAQNTFAYTLENKSFIIQCGLVDAYIQVNAEIIINRYNRTPISFPILNKLIPFKGETSISFNQIIHRLMASNKDLESVNYIGLPAFLNLTFQAKKNSDNTIIDEISFATFKFIAGLKKSVSPFGILDFNLKPNRASLASLPFVNLFLPAGKYCFRTFRNDQAYQEQTLEFAFDIIYPRQLYFADFAIGDTITVDVIKDGGITTPIQTKKFVIFPEQRYFNTIVWDDEFLMQKSIDCLGSFNIKSELEFTTQKTIIDLVEKLEILDNTKDVKIQINTGWLMYSDTDTVESLMRCKKAYLQITNSNDTIDLRPIGKSIINQDSEKELIEYTLEFTINKKYNEETYSL